MTRPFGFAQDRRYRYDAERKTKIKTVGLIVEEGPWEANSRRIPNNKIVYVRIKFDEIYLTKVVKGASGRWNKEKKL